MKDAVVSNNSFSIPNATDGSIEVVSALQGVKGNLAPTSYLRARNFINTDKYGGTQKLRVQSSASSTSNFKAYSIQMDKADYGALLNLGNKARRVKAYEYYNFTNADRGSGTNNNTTAGLSKQTKAAGVPDPVKISDIARGYLATTNLPTVTAAGFTEGSALLTGIGAGAFVVTPGGFAQNNSVYSNVADYLLLSTAH